MQPFSMLTKDSEILLEADLNVTWNKFPNISIFTLVYKNSKQSSNMHSIHTFHNRHRETTLKYSNISNLSQISLSVQHMYSAALAIPIQGKSYFAVDLKFALKLTQTLKYLQIFIVLWKGCLLSLLQQKTINSDIQLGH